jgi:AraC-like DNA-binding protein
MNLFDQIDMMARGGSIALLALWSWILMRDHRNVLAAQLAVAMCIAISCYLIVTSGWYTRPMVIGLVLALGAGATPGLFWLFAKAWFNDESKLSRMSILLVSLSVVNTLVMQLSFPWHGLVNSVTGVIFRIAMLAFAAAALWEVWRSREGDLVEGRRKLRTRLILVVSIYVIVIAFTEVAAHNGLIAHRQAHIVGAFAVFVIFYFCVRMLGMRQAELFGSQLALPRRDAQKITDDDPLIEKLRAHMKSDMPHRDETLSIAKLAAQLGEQEYRLRRTINRAMGHRNFASFLNGYRLSEVKAALADPSQRDVPIITIALDAGFGSLGPFNRAFREAEGMTPSEYRTTKAG